MVVVFLLYGSCMVIFFILFLSIDILFPGERRYFIIILQSLSWKMRDSATGESALMMEKMYQWPSEPMR